MFIIKKQYPKKESQKEHTFKISYARAALSVGQSDEQWMWSLSVSAGQPGPSWVVFPRQAVLRPALPLSQQKGSQDQSGAEVEETVLAQGHLPWAVAIPEVRESQWCTSDKAQVRVLWVSFL